MEEGSEPFVLSLGMWTELIRSLNAVHEELRELKEVKAKEGEQSLLLNTLSRTGSISSVTVSSSASSKTTPDLSSIIGSSLSEYALYMASCEVEDRTFRAKSVVHMETLLASPATFDKILETWYLTWFQLREKFSGNESVVLNPTDFQLVKEHEAAMLSKKKSNLRTEARLGFLNVLKTYSFYFFNDPRPLESIVPKSSYDDRVTVVSQMMRKYFLNGRTSCKGLVYDSESKSYLATTYEFKITTKVLQTELLLVHRHKQDNHERFIKGLEGYPLQATPSSNGSALEFTDELNTGDSSQPQSSSIPRQQGKRGAALPVGPDTVKRGKNKTAASTARDSSSSSSSSNSSLLSGRNGEPKYVETSNDEYRSWLQCQHYGEALIENLLRSKTAAEADGRKVFYYRGKDTGSTTTWHRGSKAATSTPQVVVNASIDPRTTASLNEEAHAKNAEREGIEDDQQRKENFLNLLCRSSSHIATASSSSTVVQGPVTTPVMTLVEGDNSGAGSNDSEIISSSDEVDMQTAVTEESTDDEDLLGQHSAGTKGRGSGRSKAKAGLKPMASTKKKKT